MKIDNFEAMLEEIGRDRGIKKEALLEAIKAAMLSAAKKHLKEPEEELRHAGCHTRCRSLLSMSFADVASHPVHCVNWCDRGRVLWERLRQYAIRTARQERRDRR